MFSIFHITGGAILCQISSCAVPGYKNPVCAFAKQFLIFSNPLKNAIAIFMTCRIRIFRCQAVIYRHSHKPCFCYKHLHCFFYYIWRTAEETATVYVIEHSFCIPFSRRFFINADRNLIFVLCLYQTIFYGDFLFYAGNTFYSIKHLPKIGNAFF